MSVKKNQVLVFIVGLIIVNLVVYLLKDTIRRPRPTEILTDYSFPSAHAANAFFVASYLSGLLARRKNKPSGLRRVKVTSGVLYFLAILVGYSRLYLHVHYLSDVIGGAIIGLLVAKVIAIRK